MAELPRCWRRRAPSFERQTLSACAERSRAVSEDSKSRKRLVYFADPMCSWCYGFAPAIAAIAERFEDRMPLQLVMGGLRAGNTVAMRPEDKDYIRDAWTRVGA